MPNTTRTTCDICRKETAAVAGLRESGPYAYCRTCASDEADREFAEATGWSLPLHEAQAIERDIESLQERCTALARRLADQPSAHDEVQAIARMLAVPGGRAAYLVGALGG